ncbi:MAG: protein kinase [Myxococcales bacterium]|nr:protein kinase [Myxococcales bacterium]
MSDSPPLVPGQKLGRFLIVEPTGQDSLGRTYLAEDTRFGVQVSLRLFPAVLALGPAVAALGQELLRARSVFHPNLARIFDLHDEGEHTFLTLEHASGPSLARMLAESTLPPERYLRILSRSCEALSTIHQSGLSHGALTPASVTVRSGDQPLITDFGLGGTRLRLVQGDLHPLELLLWLAPEVANTKLPSARGDVFALGAMLYRCITGKPPYPGRNPAEAYKALLSGKLVPPRLFNPDISPELERLVVRALSSDPGRRQPDATALLKELLSASPETAAAKSLPTSPAIPTAASIAEREDVLDERDAHTQEIPWRDKTILMSDIVGITAYFDTHGDMAGRRRIQRHNELLFPLIQAQRGTVVKTIGDAILATFDTADEGVRAAVNMQRALQQHNRALPDAGERLQIRIGLNSGQCIVEAQDVFGDAVNVAARVCSKAGAEQIMISAATRAQLKAMHAPMVFFARTTLKGKEEEFDLFLVGWDPDRPLPQERRDVSAQEGPATREMAAAAPKASPQEAHIPTVSLPAFEGKPGSGAFPFDLPDLSESLRPPAPPQRRSLSDEIQAVTLPGEALPDEPGSQSGQTPAIGSDVKTIYIAEPAPPAAAPGQASPLKPRTEPAREKPRMGRAVLVLSLLLAGALVWVVVLVFASLQPAEPEPPHNPPASEPASPAASEPRRPNVSPDTGAPEPEDAGAPAPEDAGLAEPADSVQPPPAELKPPKNDKPPRLRPEEARRRLLQSIRRKGIIPGDLPDLDKEIQRLPQLEKNSKDKELLTTYLKVQALVDSVQVGKDFVEKKLLRFNRTFDRLSESAGSTERTAALTDIAQVLQEVDRAMNGQNFVEANRQLNRAFEILKKIR